MSQATYEFDLSNPDDVKQFALMGKATDMALALMELDEKLRHEIKYGDHQASISDTFQSTRDMLHTILSEHGIDLDTLVD